MPVSDVPDLPGSPVHPEKATQLKALVAQICGLAHHRFVGSQPVSFARSDLDKLEQKDYWVCEKSDGIRVLVFVVGFPSGDQEVYLIDRKNSYRQVEGVFFPHHENPRRPMGHSLLDGELVTDVDPHTGRETPRLLLFDCIVVDNQNLTLKPLTSRYGKLQMWVWKPYERMVKEFPDMAIRRPFDIQVKAMERAYAVKKVLREDLPRLHHSNDGLIYTCAESGYVAGTDEQLLKWKPPSQNSIDFKLELRFPPSREHPEVPDLYAKPMFLLFVWQGGSSGNKEAEYKYFDYMHVRDAEWERMKESGEQYDDRIIEAVWDTNSQNWRFLRFRDKEKEHGNHASVVEKIIQSIQDGVEEDALISRSASVREAWKARESCRAVRDRPQHALPPTHHPIFKPQLGPLLSKVSGPTAINGINR
ncbi:hypothetical protein BOTBODRAFT_162340 [Botryobasidium botryosum FD-172 SS1]|uniref:mRNA-capping enzyme subunit alpha n=1 Tax=Botryobasidium botryosum (strain FD-172 SS1) TaxID=930990 RepID=A0A067M8M4_BOTB1|nr:hypothetical protein BOTBODRAFT_162340 [Botryobasidium botryosum FD-172 SS1]